MPVASPKIDLSRRAHKLPGVTGGPGKGERDMTQKSSSSTITSTEVRELLRTAARRLSAREEKALRMRSGASVGLDHPLPRRGQEHPEARAELLALELELKQK